MAEQFPGPGRPTRKQVYDRLDQQIAELWQRLGGLPSPIEASDIWEGIWYQEAHHSTAIEGNTLVLRQVQALLSEGRAVGNKELREYMEVRGYASAAEWVYTQASSPQAVAGHSQILSIAEVREVHHKAMSPVWEVAPHPQATEHEGPGNFRQHDIEPFQGGMKPVSWPLVPANLETWVNEANRLESQGYRPSVVSSRDSLPIRTDPSLPRRQWSERGGCFSI